MKKLFISAAAVALIAACGESADAPSDVLEAGADAAVDGAQRALVDLGNITLRSGDATEASAALAAMSLSESGAGRISFAGSSTGDDGATFTDVEISIPEDDGGEGGQILVGTLEFDGLDMVDGEPGFSKMSMDNIRIVPNDPEDAEEGELTVGNIELLNPSPALAAWMASLSGDSEPEAFPTGTDLAFDSWSLADMAFNLDDGSDVVTFNLDTVQLGGASGSGLSLAEISGISLNADPKGEDAVNLTLGSLSMTGIGEKVMSAVEAGIESGYEGEAFGSGKLMEAIYADPLEPGYDTMMIDDVAFEMGGVNFTLPSLSARVERNDAGVAIGSLTEPFTATLAANPEAGKSGAELAGMLGMLGYEAVTLRGAGKATIDPESDSVMYETAENYYAIDDGFTLRFGADMSGISEYTQKISQMDLEAASPDTEILQDAASALTFSTLTIQLEDDSIVDRAFNLYAAQSGEDPAAVRQQAQQMIQLAPMMAGGAGVDMAIVTEITTAMAAFLQDPGTLTFSLDPETPLSAETFAGLEDPSAITKDMLGLSVTHE
ncbi:MAG: hypothetical protein AAF829_07895 [Pseudomonadota bacterium]